jgi:hypothetical protein
VTDRAELYSLRSCSGFHVGVLVLVLGSGVAGCAPPGRAFGVYTHDARVLVRVDYDYNGDGRIDVRTYMRGARPVRLEGDANGDGRIDRWEYYGPSGELQRIGASTQLDGREDTWVRTAGGERHVEISTRRDGTVDRRESYRGETLVRTEADTNHDGLPDTWQEFSEGALVRLLLDESGRSGRPTRRIHYARDGTARIERIDQSHETKEGDDASR